MFNSQWKMRGAIRWPVWTRNKVLLGCAFGIILYSLFSTGEYTVEYSGYVNCTDSNTVWEFVADFSNMKKLNPTLRSFTILSESGNYNKWRYDVEYVENLHIIPSIVNTATASYEVFLINQNEYAIRSRHHTCFYGTACLKSLSQFKFVNVGAARTFCQEEVVYQCPRVFSKLCRSEVMFQRESIFHNLNMILCHK